MCRVQQVAPRSVLLNPERFDDCVYVVLEGQVQVQLDAAGERVVTSLEAGSCIGEMSALEGIPPSATVVAVTGCRLLVIDGAAVRNALGRSAVVAYNLLRILSRRLRKDNLLVNENFEHRRELEQHARLDALTGLYNRRWFDSSLDVLLGRAGTRLSLLMMDVDHFKQYNDFHGHLAGDGALETVAHALRTSIRPGDHAVRFGGEELAVLLPDATLDEACVVAEWVRDAVRAETVYDQAGALLPRVSVSIGVSEWSGTEPGEQLLARADAALYRAKQAGRNRVAVQPGFAPIGPMGARRFPGPRPSRPAGRGRKICGTPDAANTPPAFTPAVSRRLHSEADGLYGTIRGPRQ